MLYVAAVGMFTWQVFVPIEAHSRLSLLFQTLSSLLSNEISGFYWGCFDPLLQTPGCEELLCLHLGEQTGFHFVTAMPTHWSSSFHGNAGAVIQPPLYYPCGQLDDHHLWGNPWRTESCPDAATPDKATTLIDVARHHQVRSGHVHTFECPVPGASPFGFHLQYVDVTTCSSDTPPIGAPSPFRQYQCEVDTCTYPCCGVWRYNALLCHRHCHCSYSICFNANIRQISHVAPYQHCFMYREDNIRGGGAQVIETCILSDAAMLFLHVSDGHHGDISRDSIHEYCRD